MNRSANWLAWCMHGVLGLFVGAFFGLMVIYRRRVGGFWIREDLILPVLLGAALIGAGLGSRFGDRLWLGDNYRMLPPDEPEQSDLSDWISWSLVAAGVATVSVALFKHFQFI